MRIATDHRIDGRQQAAEGINERADDMAAESRETRQEENPARNEKSAQKPKRRRNRMMGRKLVLIAKITDVLLRMDVNRLKFVLVYADYQRFLQQMRKSAMLAQKAREAIKK